MKDIRLDSPLQGRLIPLSEVSDPAFASGAMGRGAAVADPEGRVVSPVDGEVTVLFETKHAIGIHGADGVDILIHVWRGYGEARGGCILLHMWRRAIR